MNSFRFAIILIQFLIVIPVLAQKKADSLFVQLNQSIAKKNEYVNAKLERLHVLHQELNVERLNDEQRFKILQKLSNEYKTFIYDSAFSNILKMQQVANRLKDPVKNIYAKNPTWICAVVFRNVQGDPGLVASPERSGNAG